MQLRKYSRTYLDKDLLSSVLEIFGGNFKHGNLDNSMLSIVPPFSDYWLSASGEKFVSLNITYVGKDFGYFSWNLGCQKVPFADDSAAAEECRVLTLEMLDRAIASLHLPDSCEKIRDEAQTF